MHSIIGASSRQCVARLSTVTMQKSLLSAALFMVMSSSAFANPPSDSEVADLKAQVQSLRSEQAERDSRIAGLEAALAKLMDTPVRGESHQEHTRQASSATPLESNTGPSRLNISGDLRVRLQGDYSDDLAPGRESSQVRARIGATYDVSDRVTVGARLVTGDSGDPNSTDVQLSNFNDDLEVSLDQAYIRLNFNKLNVFGGKFPQPFTRTDLVWDSDVMPQGVAATYKHPDTYGGQFRANGMFFVVDEQAADSDSTMAGLQFGYQTRAFNAWSFDTSLGYYDYSLGSIAGADAGDFRSNLRNPDGTYRSDFNLVNLIAGISHSGFSPSWPMRLTFDLVKNRGAATSADTGYGVDFSAGKSSDVGDVRFTYGYSAVETDAVFAAFSHDNIGIATNYKLHSLTLDYVPSPKTLITGIWYHYRPFREVDSSPRSTSDWMSRFRLAFLVNF